MFPNEKVEEFLASVAKSPLSALLLDYDGTLAPFTIDRQQAVPYNGVVDVLQQIVDTGRTRLILVTGREAHEVGPLLGIKPYPEVWGSHGLQRLRADGTCHMPEIPHRVSQALDEAHRWLNYQGLHELAEDKPGSIAVHWRALDEASAGELRGRILLGWFPIAARGSMTLAEFDGGVEMRMPDLDKGDAVRIVLSELGANVPIAYLGDDATDEQAFRALRRYGLTVLVRPRFRRTAAQVWLKPPQELLAFLDAWRDGITLAQPFLAATRPATEKVRVT